VVAEGGEFEIGRAMRCTIKIKHRQWGVRALWHVVVIGSYCFDRSGLAKAYLKLC